MFVLSVEGYEYGKDQPPLWNTHVVLIANPGGLLRRGPSG